MGIAGAILGCLLLGQASDAAVPSRYGRTNEASALLEPANPASVSAAVPAASPTKPIAQRRLPPDLVAEAVVLPSGSRLSGQPLTLLNALTATQDRRQQLELTFAYWRLVQCVADYRYCMEHSQNLDRVQASAGESSALRLAQASATAMLRQAELEATGAQYELARLAQLPTAAPLPLPADRPHVGAYRTNFKELFAGKTPPETAMLMDRVLPIRRQTIDDQAAAVLAAEDVFAAAAEQRQGDVIQSSEELLRQRRTFIRIVCDYNRNIAQYGLTVASPTTTPQSLVAMLISATPPSNVPSLLSGGRPAGHIEPIANVARQPSRNATSTAPAGSGWRSGQPTLAPPRDAAPQNASPQPATTQERGRSAANVPPSLAPADPGVRAVSNEEPTLAPPPSEALQSVRDGEPTLAPLRGSVQQSQDTNLTPANSAIPPMNANEPTLAPPRKGERPGRDGQSTQSPARGIEQPVQPPLRQEPEDLEDQPLVPIERTSATEPLTEEPRTAQKPVTGNEAATIEAISALYPALVKASPAVRTRQLTVALHWDRELPEGMGYALTLLDCLTRDSGSNRRATIAAYWQVRQRAAEYQVLAQQVAWLEGLTGVVLERRSQPSGAADMLRLRSAQLTATASLHEAHAALVEAQYALAVQIGATNDQAWPIASTIPHSGRYELRLDSQPQSLVDSWPVRRLAATIPALGESVQQHAAAVVESDAARVATAEKYRKGEATIDQTIDSVLTQTRETQAILSTLTDYNRALADYVLTVVPANTSASRLVASLVVKP